MLCYWYPKGPIECLFIYLFGILYSNFPFIFYHINSILLKIEVFIHPFHLIYLLVQSLYLFILTVIVYIFPLIAYFLQFIFFLSLFRSFYHYIILLFLFTHFLKLFEIIECLLFSCLLLKLRILTYEFSPLAIFFRPFR